MSEPKKTFTDATDLTLPASISGTVIVAGVVVVLFLIVLKKYSKLCFGNYSKILRIKVSTKDSVYLKKFCFCFFFILKY